MDIPEGFAIELVDCIPPEVLATYTETRWAWLRETVTKMDTDEVRRISCPDRREAGLAHASLNNQCTRRMIPGHSLVCRKTAKNGAVDGPWYLYVQKVLEETSEK